MAVVRLTADLHDQVRQHLFSSPGEHFAFLLCDTTSSMGEPIFMAGDAVLVPDDEATVSNGGLELSDGMMDTIINTAVRRRAALVECHNHGGSLPRFSAMDYSGIEAFSRYCIDVLESRPYGATVWGNDTVYGEARVVDPTGSVVAKPLTSVNVLGRHLRQLISMSGDEQPPDDVFQRQLIWFGEFGQRQLARLRVGIVGCGGTGSHVSQQLAYLGVRAFALVEPDTAEMTNLNRTVTATPAMTGMPKVWAAVQRVREVAPSAHVDAFQDDLRSAKAIDVLRGVDVLIGCVDNDGPRLILNRLALAYGIPYLDVATDLVPNDEGKLEAIGGRVAVVAGGPPCLGCMGLLDKGEVAYYFSSPEQQEEARRRGYAGGTVGPSPSVVSLNGLSASVLATEFAVLVSGVRPVQALTEVDVLGAGRSLASTWVTPFRVAADPRCFECQANGRGDDAELEVLLPDARTSHTISSLRVSEAD